MKASSQIELDFLRESTSVFQKSVLESVTQKMLRFQSESTNLHQMELGFDLRNSDQIKKFTKWEEKFREKYLEALEGKIVDDMLGDSTYSGNQP